MNLPSLKHSIMIACSTLLGGFLSYVQQNAGGNISVNAIIVGGLAAGLIAVIHLYQEKPGNEKATSE